MKAAFALAAAFLSLAGAAIADSPPRLPNKPFICAEWGYLEIKSAEQDEALALIGRDLVAENWQCTYYLKNSKVAICTRPDSSGQQADKSEYNNRETLTIVGMCFRRIQNDFIIRFHRRDPIEAQQNSGWRVIER